MKKNIIYFFYHVRLLKSSNRYFQSSMSPTLIGQWQWSCEDNLLSIPVRTYKLKETGNGLNQTAVLHNQRNQC